MLLKLIFFDNIYDFLFDTIIMSGAFDFNIQIEFSLAQLDDLI